MVTEFYKGNPMPGLGFVVKMNVKVWEISVMKKNVMKQMKGDTWSTFPKALWSCDEEEHNESDEG